MMAAQLVGTGGVGLLVVLAALQDWAALDVALVLALLAALAAVGFVKARSPDGAGDPEEEPPAPDAPARGRHDGGRRWLIWRRSLLTAAGLFFFVAGTVGLIRFPDTFSRLHALTKADNLGLGFIALGIAFQAETWAQVARLALIWALALLAAGAMAQLVARTALDAGRRRMTLALDLALCALILGVALATVAGRGVFRAMVFFIVYGLLVAVGWVRLGAIDVALAEAAIGAGLTGCSAAGRARPALAHGHGAGPGARRASAAALAGVRRWPGRWPGRGSSCRCPSARGRNWPKRCRAPGWRTR
jgi:multicomponent Na+:H+ antiporter subunit G